MQGRPSEMGRMLYDSVEPGKAYTALHFISKRLKDIFHIDPNHCDAVELTLLKLAGIEEKPDKCTVDGGIIPLLPQKKLVSDYLISNSVFFKIPLSTGSMKQLLQFLKEKNIKFHDYTDALSENNEKGEQNENSKKLKIRLFCIHYESFQNILCPEIIKYLRDHRQAVEEHHEEMDKKTNKISCYKYQRCLAGSIYQEEYFIPSEKICFNSNGAYRADKPDNRDEKYFESHTILKRVSIPSHWVEKLKEKLNENDPVALDPSETRRYFDAYLQMDFLAEENMFEQRYYEFGTFILPNYIMSYLEDENSVNTNSSTAIRILELIDNLYSIEKQSLAICLQERMIKKAAEKNANKSYEFPISLTTGATAVAAGSVAGFLSDSAPVGIFATGLVMFGMKKYDAYFKKQREEYRNKIFDALGIKPMLYATPYDPWLPKHEMKRLGMA